MSNAPAAGSPKPIPLHEFRKQRKPHRNIYRKHRQSPGLLACRITDRVGTMGFFLVVLVWTVLWLGNPLGAGESAVRSADGLCSGCSSPPHPARCSCAHHGRPERAGPTYGDARQHDLAVNVKAEEEIGVILEHLSTRTPS